MIRPDTEIFDNEPNRIVGVQESVATDDDSKENDHNQKSPDFSGLPETNY